MNKDQLFCITGGLENFTVKKDAYAGSFGPSLFPAKLTLNAIPGVDRYNEKDFSIKNN